MAQERVRIPFTWEKNRLGGGKRPSQVGSKAGKKWGSSECRTERGWRSDHNSLAELESRWALSRTLNSLLNLQNFSLVILPGRGGE